MVVKLCDFEWIFGSMARKSKSEAQEFVCDVCDVAMLRCCDAMFAIDAIDASDLTENGRYRNTMFISVPVASWLENLRCHSSMRSFKNRPVMSLGTNAPDGRITFPSKLRRHLPCLMYSSTPGQSRINLSQPSKLQCKFHGPCKGP